MRPSRSLFPILWIFICLGSVAALASAAELPPPVSPLAHTIEGLGKDAIPLEGAWAFHTGDDPSWASPSLDDSQWTRITADDTWGSQGFYAFTGYAWYRYHLTIDPTTGTSKDLALLIPQIDDAYELYWNGQLIGKNGKLPPDPTWYISQPPQTYGLGHIVSGVLAIRVWKSVLASNDAGTLGGFEGMPYLGSPEAIANRKAQNDYKWLRGQQFTFGLDSLYALVALLSLLGWFRDRKQWVLLAMAGYALMPIAGQVLSQMRIPFPYVFALGMLQPVLMLQDICLWILVLLLLDLENSKRIVHLARLWIFAFVIAFGLDGVITFWWGSQWARQMQLADAVLTCIFTPLETFPIVLVIAALVQRKRLDPARWAVAAAAFITEMIFVVRNGATQFVRFTHWTLGDKLAAPLFTINGNPIGSRQLANILLLISIVYAVYRFSIENRKQQAALEQEFKNAAELQQVLIPETLPVVPGFTVTSAYRPAQQVGGDFFQIIPIEGGSTLVILGDVSGKGLRAAMAVSLIVGALRALADDYPSPAHLLTQLNRRLFGRLQGGFATCLILLLKPNSTCTVASAGHPAPYLNKTEIEIPGALPLGVSQSTAYMEREFATRPGDHFALYTDGLLEARNRTGELYGFARLDHLFSSPTNAETATQAAVNFGQDDDITVLTLTRLTAGEESLAIHLAPSLQS
ncbi:SpoIIE family protein phosphatase [Telmatobacter sp. DSM 110680]|uniref:SpoIIE family protein phosphatase n=1 Tax=Telmatobacter sp. DSM 110680 TaxID=3036704 RepID=A0AAU7DK93_9BACT